MKADKVYLAYILECISNIDELTVNGRDALDKHGQAALLYYLQTMAESTQKLSEVVKDGTPEID